MVIIQTTALNGNLSFFFEWGGGVLEEFGGVCVWGLYPESLSRRGELTVAEGLCVSTD